VVVVGAAVVVVEVRGGSWARAGQATDAGNATRLAVTAISERDRRDMGCRGYRPVGGKGSHCRCPPSGRPVRCAWARPDYAWVTAPFSAPVTRRANLASTPEV
jgi:hypothetical protein